MQNNNYISKDYFHRIRMQQNQTLKNEIINKTNHLLLHNLDNTNSPVILLKIENQNVLQNIFNFLKNKYHKDAYELYNQNAERIEVLQLQDLQTQKIYFLEKVSDIKNKEQIPQIIHIFMEREKFCKQLQVMKEIVIYQKQHGNELYSILKNLLEQKNYASLQKFINQIIDWLKLFNSDDLNIDAAFQNQLNEKKFQVIKDELLQVQKVINPDKNAEEMFNKRIQEVQNEIQNQKQQYKILENSQIQLQIIKVELQKNYEELQYKYEELQDKYEELEQKYQAEVQTNNELKRTNQNFVEQQALNLEMKDLIFELQKENQLLKMEKEDLIQQLQKENQLLKMEKEDQILQLQKENYILKKQKEDLILQIQKENQLLKMEKEDQNYQCKGQNDQINKQQLQTHNEQMKYNQQEIKPERNKQNYNKRSTQDQPENLNVDAIQEEKQEITEQNNYEKTKSRVRQTINSPQKTRQQQQQQQQKDSQLNVAQQNQQSESIQKQIFKIEEVQIKTEFTNHCGHLITEQQLKIALNQSIKYKGQPYCPKCAKDIIDWQIHFPLLRQKFKDEIDQTNLERLIKLAEIKFKQSKSIQIAKCPKCNFVCFWDSKILSGRYNSYCQKCEYSTVKNPYK